MRIVQFRLIAFGPFTDHILDLSGENGGLHIVYGPNEAGKSTALRGLTALFYGFDARSRDHFLHKDYGKLRIGATIRRSGGAELDFIRRKGRKNTIIDQENNPMSESRLDGFLGGVTKETFLMQFGIDHNELVEGGESILEGKGKIGEILFTAGMGTAGVRNLLRELQTDADALYKPRGMNPKINERITECKHAEHDILEYSLKSREWKECNRNLENALEEKKGISEKLLELDRKKKRLERIQDAKPIISQLNELQRERVETGDVILLPASFSEDRREALIKLDNAQQAGKKAEQDLAELDEKISRIVIPEELLKQKIIIDNLHKRLGVHIKAAEDKIALEREARDFQIHADAILKEINPDLEPDKAERLKLTAAKKSRLQALGNSFQALHEAHQGSEENLQVLMDELVEAEGNFRGLPDSRDSSVLRRVLKRAIADGNPEAEADEIRCDLLVLKKQAEIDLNKLFHWSGGLQELMKIPIPPAKMVDRFDRDFNELDANAKGLEDRLSETEKEAARLERKLNELDLAGSVPAEDELDKAREHRQTGWKLVRRAWLEGASVDDEARLFDAGNALPEAYEKSVDSADDLADRLRREAKRVENRAHLQVDYDDRMAKREKLAEQIREKGDLKSELSTLWNSIWRKSGVEPLPPGEMRSWIQKQAELTQNAKKQAELESRLTRLTRKSDDHREELNSCLDALGAERGDFAEEFAYVIDRCQSALDEMDGAEATRRQLADKTRELKTKLKKAAGKAENARRKMESWRSDWSAAVVEIGLSPKATPNEANRILNRLEELFEQTYKAKDKQNRIADIQLDSKRFVKEVKTLVSGMAPESSAAPPRQILPELKARLDKAVRDDVALRGLTERREKEQSAREKAGDTVKAMTARLCKLAEQAGCADYRTLDEHEKKSARAGEIDRDIRSLQSQLSRGSGDCSLDEFIATADSEDADSLPAQIDELVAETGNLRGTLSELDQLIGERKSELGKMDGGSKAADAAEEKQGILAEIREKAEEYIRLRMAWLILNKTIDRYRRENESPMLARAGAYLRKLTLDSFIELKSDLNEKDEPIIVGVRSDGEEVSVEGMSDGTRDQLYLALRLAGIDRYLETGEPFPIIADDILIRFDDDRAKAALGALADLSKKTQVILFTHHYRIVELAKEAFPDAALNLSLLDLS